MATIIPEGELLRRAVVWIDTQRSETGRAASDLIDQAALRFNLGPKDTEFLVGFFKEQREADRR